LEEFSSVERENGMFMLFWEDIKDMKKKCRNVRVKVWEDASIFRANDLG